MNRRATTSLCFVALALLTCRTAWALDRDLYDLSLDELSDLVITDTKVTQALETVTQKVELLYPKDFERQTTYRGNMAELLMYTSGQFVNPLSRNDPNWGSSGGLGPKYNGYLLDGLPIDSFADAMSLDPWIFEHVEIQKGPASVMYSNYLSMDFAGNETPLAGTTNFVLKDWIEAPATRIMLGGGSYRSYTGRFYHQNRRKNLTYFLGAALEQSQYTNYGISDSWLHIVDAPNYAKTKVYAKLTYLFDRDDHKLSLFANRTHHTGDAGRPNRDFAHQYDLINGTYSNQINRALNLQVKAGVRNYNRRWSEDNFPADLGLREEDGIRQRIYPMDLTLNVAHLRKSVLSLGADTQFASYSSYDEVAGISHTGTDVSARSHGVFAQEKFVFERWVVRLGGRFNHTAHSYHRFAGALPSKATNVWNTALWSTGVRYNFSPHLAVFSNVGSSFVAPSAKQLGGTLRASSSGVPGAHGQLPNLALQPEEGISADIGLDLRPLDPLLVGARVSFSQIDKAIVENVVSTTPSQSQSMNVGRVHSFAFELSVEHRVTDYLRWFANVTCAGNRVANSLDDDQDGSNVPFVPNFVANEGMTVRLPSSVYLSPYFHVVGRYYDRTEQRSRRRLGPYSVLNVRVQKRLVATETFEAHAAIDLNNLLNKRYEMPWQFRDPGFNAMGSLELSF